MPSSSSRRPSLGSLIFKVSVKIAHRVHQMLKEIDTTAATNFSTTHDKKGHDEVHSQQRTVDCARGW